MEAKRYWLKLEKNFMQSKYIKIIKGMENGNEYILFYLALMLESIEEVGHLRLSEVVPYNEKTLSSVTDTNIDIVRTAMKLFQELGMIRILEDGTIFLPEVPALTGRESESAERVRKFRERQKLLQCNAKVTKSNDNIQYNITEHNTIKKVVTFLNETAGTKYKAGSAITVRHVTARINEGFTFDDFKAVIEKKCNEWIGTEMAKYIRPETLFGAKFESYLNQKSEKEKPKKKEKEKLPEPPPCPKCGKALKERAVGVAGCIPCKVVFEYKDKWREQE